MKQAFAEGAQAGESVEQLKARLRATADRIPDDDVESCRAIGRHGAAVVPARARVLTHCNAGALATCGVGTALGVIRAGLAMGKTFTVYADETRPLLQGARLTAWELMQDGIDVVLLPDGAAAHLMWTGKVQAVVTGGACHLDARQVATALDAIDLADTDLLFVENVGNLVCPASWDLGEEAKVVLFAVTEGEDKPLKYPKMFREARFAVLTKVDLLPHVPFDVERALGFAREVNPDLRFFRTSAWTGEGLDPWFDWLRQLARRPAPV